MCWSVVLALRIRSLEGLEPDVCDAFGFATTGVMRNGGSLEKAIGDNPYKGFFRI